jgi:hypothetical protein
MGSEKTTLRTLVGAHEPVHVCVSTAGLRDVYLLLFNTDWERDLYAVQFYRGCKIKKGTFVGGAKDTVFAQAPYYIRYSTPIDDEAREEFQSRASTSAAPPLSLAIFAAVRATYFVMLLHREEAADDAMSAPPSGADVYEAFRERFPNIYITQEQVCDVVAECEGRRFVEEDVKAIIVGVVDMLLSKRVLSGDTTPVTAQEVRDVVEQAIPNGTVTLAQCERELSKMKERATDK